MEVGQVIDHPSALQALIRLRPCLARRRQRRGTQDDEVQPPRGRVIDPPRSKVPYAMQGRHVYLLSVDELVFGAVAQVVDVLDEERVGCRQVSEEDDLGAAPRQFQGGDLPNARSAARDHDDAPVHVALGRVICAAAVHLREHDGAHGGGDFDEGPRFWHPWWRAFEYYFGYKRKQHRWRASNVWISLKYFRLQRSSDPDTVQDKIWW